MASIDGFPPIATRETTHVGPTTESVPPPVPATEPSNGASPVMPIPERSGCVERRWVDELIDACSDGDASDGGLGGEDPRREELRRSIDEGAFAPRKRARKPPPRFADDHLALYATSGRRRGRRASRGDEPKLLKKPPGEGVYMDRQTAHPLKKKRGSSRFLGVFRDVTYQKWRAEYKGKHLGRFNSEEEAARAVDEEVTRVGLSKDRLNVAAVVKPPVKRPNASSRFRGVHKIKDGRRWRGYFIDGHKTTHIGTFKTEEDAARAYNTEVHRRGLPPQWLNVISGETQNCDAQNCDAKEAAGNSVVRRAAPPITTTAATTTPSGLDRNLQDQEEVYMLAEIDLAEARVALMEKKAALAAKRFKSSKHE